MKLSSNIPSDLQPKSTDLVAKEWLDDQLTRIENHLNRDGLSITGPLAHGVDHRVRIAVEGLEPRRESLLVILDTPGGIVEIVERIATTLRTLYSEVNYLVPDRAMSAGTVLVMSGDDILMDYFSCLGPIDPQIERDGRLVPALSYLAQYRRLIEKARDGTLTTAELVLLKELDLAELHQFELAASLSVKLIKEWLTNFKFKDWSRTETRGLSVTKEMKEKRAEAIATALNDHEHWGSHGRGIHMETLRSELNLKIEDYGQDSTLKRLVWDYFWFLRDFLAKGNLGSFVHSRAFI